MSSKNTPDKVMELLDKIRGNKVILVHAGAVRLLEYIEIARAFDNVLLDLSLTLCKYPGSALDMDIRFAFNNFDQRICIGSDSPEFHSSDLRCRFNYFSEGVTDNKLRNIAYKNLSAFLPKVYNFEK